MIPPATERIKRAPCLVPGSAPMPPYQGYQDVLSSPKWSTYIPTGSSKSSQIGGAFNEGVPSGRFLLVKV